MEFCPWCGMMLLVEGAKVGGSTLRFFCPRCPYVCPIKQKIEKDMPLVRKKEVEPIFSGVDALKFTPKTEATCPKCHHGQAYFRQMQLRSADEPATTMYKCCNENCAHEWRED